MKLKQTPVSQRLRRTTYSDLIAVLPLGQHSAVLRRPPMAYGFQWGKEPKVDIQLLRHCGIHPGMPTWVLPHRAHWENLQGSTTGDQIDREGRWGLYHPVLRSWWTMFLLTVVSEQRPQPAALPICSAKSVAFFIRELD